MRRAFPILLAVLAALGFVIRPEHPHLEAEKFPLFWPLFAFVVCLALLFVAKRVAYPMLTFRGTDPREDDRDRLP